MKIDNHKDRGRYEQAKTANKQEEIHYAMGTTQQESNTQNKDRYEDIETTIWNLDSGCSVHMTSEPTNLLNKQKYHGKINLAETGRNIEATAKGEMRMEVKVNGKPIKLKLINVLYVPSLRDNLLSVKELVRRGNEVLFDKKGATIYGTNGKVIAEAREEDNMYILRAKILGENTAYNAQEEKLWHRRLGHANIQSIKEMTKRNMVHGIKYKDEKTHMENCETCIKGKLTQKPFKSVTKAQTNKPLELVHIDLCGPLQVKSLGGNSYIFVIVDDYTRMVFMELLKHKSEAYSAFLNFKNRTEKETDFRIKTVRSDNGTEFVNQNFEQLFQREGINHQKTVRYTPQSNGVAERANRTLLDTARTLLIDAKLPERFWGEAINTAVHLKNRTYKKQLGDKTPLEKWTDRKPTVGYLKTFGCKAYCWIPKQLRSNKLAPRGIQGIFVGYSRTRKAYRIYLPTERKIEESRSVKFIENEWGIDNIEIPDLGETGVQWITYNGDKVTEKESRTQKEPKSPTQHEIELPEIQRGTHLSIEEQEDIEEQQNIEEDEISEGIMDTEPEIGVKPKRGRPLGTKKGIVTERERLQEQEREQQLREKGARRSKRNEAKTQTCEMTKIGKIPNTYKEVTESEERQHWEGAMKEEIDSLKEHKVWELVEKEPGMKVLRNKWVFTTKKDPKGNITRYKARLVVVGNHQIKGIDYSESYAPVIKLESMRLIIAIAARLNLNIRRYDVKTAYLHGELEEATYMEQPKGTPETPGKVCHLLKSLYGLPQSGRSWNIKLHNTLSDIGFRRMNSDSSVYIIRRGREFTILGVYVDDCIVTGTDESWTGDLMDLLQTKFKMREEKGDGTFLGIEITRTKDGYKIQQKGQIRKILSKLGMDDCNPVKNPLDGNQDLDVYEQSPRVDVKQYQEIIGTLTYISGGTRPDITYGVNKLSQYCKEPREMHMTAAKRIVRYLKGTSDISLWYRRENGTLSANSDASWCSTKDSKSHSGYDVKIGEALISWKTKKQDLIALSTCESEINAICETVRELKWFENLLIELELKEMMNLPTPIFTDSRSAMDWANGMCVRQRTKHFDRKCYKIREEIQLKNIQLIHCCGEEMEADILTKPVPTGRLLQLRQSMGLME